MPCKGSPSSRLLPKPLAPIFPAHAAGHPVPFTMVFSWTQELLDRGVGREEREESDLEGLLARGTGRKPELCTIHSS